MKKIFLSIISLFIFSSFLMAGTTNSKPKFVAGLVNDICLSDTLDHWENLPAASTSTIAAITIATNTLTSAATTYALASADYTDVIFPRNIVVDMYFATYESTTVAAGTLAVIGYDQFGMAATESIAISTNSATGNVCWSSITSLTFTATITDATESNTTLYVGVGTKIALSNNIEASTDMVKVIEAGATSTTYTVNATYDSITFASAPNATKDYYVYYASRTNKTKYKY